MLQILEDAGGAAENVSAMGVAEFPIHRGRELLCKRAGTPTVLGQIGGNVHPCVWRRPYSFTYKHPIPRVLSVFMNLARLCADS